MRFNVVSEAAVRDCGLAWTVLRPSGFMSNALRWRPQLKAGNTIREPFADVPVALIDPFDIGAVAVRALTEDGHDGRSYRLTGPQASLRPNGWRCWPRSLAGTCVSRRSPTSRPAAR